MFTDLTHVTVLVEDQDEALGHYTDTLGFEVRDDVEMDDGERWLTVGVPGAERPQIALVPADTPEKRERVGSQAADHVFLVVETDDCREAYEALVERGVEFHGEPREMPWGVEAVFEDRYGNAFDLLEPRPAGE